MPREPTDNPRRDATFFTIKLNLVDFHALPPEFRELWADCSSRAKISGR
jgi:hypothetical protein